MLLEIRSLWVCTSLIPLLPSSEGESGSHCFPLRRIQLRMKPAGRLSGSPMLSSVSKLLETAGQRVLMTKVFPKHSQPSWTTFSAEFVKLFHATPIILICVQIGVPLKGRQRMNSKDILTYHPVDQTDSFTLYVKSSILLSRVKNFNSSFPLNQEALDSLAAPDQHPQHVDPRSTAEFQKIEAQIWAFRLNVPNHLRNPIVNNTVDGHLLAAYFTQYTYGPYIPSF